MANSAQARKRIRQSKKNALLNQSQRTRVRTSLKKVLKAVESGQGEAAVASFKEATQLLDRFSKRGLFHPNKAARLKSRLNKKVKSV